LRFAAIPKTSRAPQAPRRAEGKSASEIVREALEHYIKI
jgi:Ribbon-helix-helix protein, copG family